MKDAGIDVVIPVYRPDGRLKRLLLMLRKQTLKPEQILLVNTEEELFDTRILEGIPDIQVIHIRKKEFDHGGTRHRAAERLQGAFLLFLTQDAVPADIYLVERLYQAFLPGYPRKAPGSGMPQTAREVSGGGMPQTAGEDSGDGAPQTVREVSVGCPRRREEGLSGCEGPQVCAAYARQLPAQGCSLLEQYARSFNYGEESRVKTAADLDELGIKTFFCSNVCAMYRRSAYEELGGFERHTIFNEDMIFAGKLIKSGRAVVYCADAKVIHSHNYSGAQQFHRNFDLGVSQAEHPEIFGMAPSESEGIRMVKKTAAWLLRRGKPYLLPQLLWQSGCKYLGYRLGKSYRKLPKRAILWCTMNKGYWQ